MATSEESSDYFDKDNIDSNILSQQPSNNNEGINLTGEDNERYDKVLPSEDHQCVICWKLACEPLMADKCCGKVFCKKCLQKHLEDNKDDHTMPCPHCKMAGFTYMQLNLKVCIILAYLRFTKPFLKCTMDISISIQNG